MNKHNKSRSSFSGKIGYVLAAAGASVGLGNIWRFPYLAAKYGGGIFLLIYILLALTFGYSMIVAESAIGRMTRLDQRHYPDSDRSILLCHRRMGHQISDRIREGQQYPARRGRLFFRLHLKRSFHRALFCRFLPYYGRHHLRRCAKRH